VPTISEGTRKLYNFAGQAPTSGTGTGGVHPGKVRYGVNVEQMLQYHIFSDEQQERKS